MSVGSIALNPPVTYTGQQQSSTKNYFHKAVGYINERKKPINTWVQAIGSAVNISVFLNGIFGFFNIDEEMAEKVGNFFYRIGTATRGFTGVADCIKKNNIIPACGNALEMPIALLTSGYSLWLARGISQAIRQTQGFIKRRGMKVVNSSGETITLSKEDGDDFTKYGIKIFDGFKSTLRELGLAIKETFTNPFEKGNLFSRSLLMTSVGQFVGPILAFFGYEKTGAFVRDSSGVVVDGVYASDKAYLPCAISWIITAICDFGKRFDAISSKFKHLTQLSSAGDLIAGICESYANFGGSRTETSAAS